MLGEARATLFDRKWALICADVDRPIGTAFSWKGASDSGARLGRGRDARARVRRAGSAAELAPGAVVRRCREQGSGLEWNSYAVARDGWLHVVEGYRRVRRRAAADARQPGREPRRCRARSTSSPPAARARSPQARAALGDGEQLIGQGYRRNNAGEYTEAEEFFRPDLLDEDHAASDATLAEQRHEATVNRALQLSNLGRYDEAARLFGEARAMGAARPDPGAAAAQLRGDRRAQPRRARRGRRRSSRARCPSWPSRRRGRGGAVEIDRPLAASLNSGLAAGLTDSVARKPA